MPADDNGTNGAATAGAAAGVANDPGALSAVGANGGNGDSGSSDISGSDPISSIDKLIPADYADRGWLKNVQGKSVADFFKDYDNLQGMAGKPRYDVPADDAPQETRSAWLKSLGVPEKPEEYTIPKIQWDEKDKVSGEFLEKTRNEDYINEIKQAAHKRGIPAKMLEGLIEDNDRLLAKYHGKSLEAQIQAEDQLEAEFNKHVAERFGDRKDEVLENASKLVNKYSDKFRLQLNEMDNKSMMALVEVIEGIRQDFIADDALTGLKSGGSGGANNRESLHAEIKELRKSEPMTKGEAHKDYHKTRELIDQKYEQLRLMPKES